MSFLVYAKGQARSYPIFITLICDSHLLHGAFLYIYVLAFTNPSFRLKNKHFWHTAPMAIQIVAKLYLNYLVDEMDCYQEGGCVEGDNIYVTLTYIYKYFVLGTYIILTWLVIIRDKQNTNTPRGQMRHTWVRQIILGVTFLYVGILLLYVGRLIFPELFWERMLLGNTLTTLFIFIFLYIGNSYTYIFVSPSKSRFKNLSESFNPAACNQLIQPGEMETIFNQLNDFMENEKPYIKGQLTIKELSLLTGIPTASISQSVNTLTGKSVTDYINKFRVDLFKEKIADPSNKNYKIMVLADECGFNSKSTLVRIFKQHTGLTPSEYLKRVQPSA